MVAVFSKEHLSWYLITLKLKETVEAAGLPKSQPTTTCDPASAPVLLVDPPPLPTADEGWVVSIRESLDAAGQDEAMCPWSKVSIYRVPKVLREGGGEKSYVPQLVSLGPYHHGRYHLRDMERHKWRSLHRILQRTGHRVEVYLDAVRQIEDRARACYEGPLTLNSNEFVEMMVLDGCFVLELFRGASGEGFKLLGYNRNDPVFAIRSTMHSVQRDMIMLENQIPLFLLERLLSLQISDDHRSCGIVSRLAISFFDPLMPTDEPLRKKNRHLPALRSSSSSSSSSSVAPFDPFSDCGLHCLDVFRHSLLRVGPRPAPRGWVKHWSQKTRIDDKRQQQLVHCVTELRESGVKFRRRKTDRFWDIKFENGVLMIPRILIHDGTKSLFLNLTAFEQCHMDCTSDITSYIIFMDNLINSEEDIRYLHYRGIVEHWLGNDEEVADLFNRLCQEVVFDINGSYLSSLSEQVNKYYNHRWNTWRASLVHRYFSNPWAIVSLVAAIVLLVLTSAQTYYTVYGYYWHSS